MNTYEMAEQRMLVYTDRDGEQAVCRGNDVRFLTEQGVVIATESLRTLIPWHLVHEVSAHPRDTLLRMPGLKPSQL